MVVVVAGMTGPDKWGRAFFDESQFKAFSFRLVFHALACSDSQEVGQAGDNKVGRGEIIVP